MIYDTPSAVAEETACAWCGWKQPPGSGKSPWARSAAGSEKGRLTGASLSTIRLLIVAWATRDAQVKCRIRNRGRFAGRLILPTHNCATSCEVSAAALSVNMMLHWHCTSAAAPSC